ncbi:MAG: glycoside hydrolase family 5 protein [Rhizobiaceae bacterium]
MKLAACGALLWSATISNAAAADFQPRRGINLDQWVTWPAESQWADPAAMLPFPEWRKTLDQAGLAELKAGGFDFVRMPVDPSPFLSPTAAPLRDQLLDQVLESVRLINGAGLKVIVDLHLIPSSSARAIGVHEVLDDANMFDAYVGLVRDFGRLLAKEDPTKVAFELMNEPTIDCDEDGSNKWPGLQKRLFAAARASATRLTLVLTGACYSSAGRLAKIDPKDYPDDNIIWGFHSYNPFLLTHQGATWAGDFIGYVTGLPYPPYAVPRAELDAIVERIKEKMRAEAPWARRDGLTSYLDELLATVDTKEKLETVIEEPFTTVAQWAASNGISPNDILLGEFGMIRQEYGNDFVMPAASRAAYYKAMIDHAEKHGFAWSMWSYGGAFGVVDAFEGKKAEPDVLEMVGGLK